MPREIRLFFEQHVTKLYHDHNRTPGWVAEIVKQTSTYHRETILQQGLTDFDVAHNSLRPADKVLVYCYYYFQMHAASTLHVYDGALRYYGLGLAPHTIFLDFGCGPLTLPLALAWHHHLRIAQPEPAARLLLQYVGIEKSRQMTARAKYHAEHSGFFHSKSTFRFLETFTDVPRLCDAIDSLLPSAPPADIEIVLNMSYFIASKSVRIPELEATVGAILRRYAKHRVWLVFQNPIRTDLNEKWLGFKAVVPSLKMVAGSKTEVRYTNSTNGRGSSFPIRLYHELLSRLPARPAAGVAFRRRTAARTDGWTRSSKESLGTAPEGNVPF
jgi:hypothetical protein